MIRLLASLLALGALCIAASAAAGPIPASVLDPDDRAWFYNRPGATPEQVGRDHAECRSFGSAMFGGSNTFDPNVRYGLTGQVMLAIAAAGPTVAYADDCMMAKGYRRFDVAGRQRDFQERLAQASAEAQAAYAGAEAPPEGVLARVWVNSYWLGKEPLRSAGRSFTPRAARIDAWGQLHVLRRLAEGAQIALRPNEAVLFMTLRAPSSRGYILFDRRDPATGEGSRTQVGERTRWPGFEARTEREDGALVRLAFVVPEGVYSLANKRTGRYDATLFCLGTIAFRVRAGEALDLGDFTIEQAAGAVDALAPPPRTRLRIEQPEMSPERATALGASTHAAQLSAARYFNGFPRICQMFSRSYGFDLPGAAWWGE